MDFLDPRKRKSRAVRLAIGYFLMSVVVALGTIIIVYGAYGYGINTQTGQIIQNGLVFVDSHPAGAEIYLNGQDQHSASAARLVLQTGNYTLTLKRSGYRSWSRSFQLEDQSILRFDYPFLFPVKPVETKLKTYSSAPPLITQSPDQRWLLVEVPSVSGHLPTFDEYDTTNLKKAPISISLPDGLVTQPGQLSLVEWSTDNKNVLLKNSFGGKDEYIIFNRAQPASSINVNRALGTDPSSVALYDKKPDKLYVYDQAAETLKLADLSNDSLGPVLIDSVLAFKPYGTHLITYVTDKNMQPGQVQARIWDGGNTYPLYTFSAGSKYLIDAAQFNGHFYYVAGSNTSGRINIYKDPLNNIQDPSIGRAIPSLALNLPGAQKESFSASAQFIETDSGQNVRVYDIQNQKTYSYTLTSQLAAPLKWMDGDRLMGESGGQVFVTDFDSTNQQMVTATSDPDGGFFSSDFNHLLTWRSTSAGVDLYNVDMRAGVDLPKNY